MYSVVDPLLLPIMSCRAPCLLALVWYKNIRSMLFLRLIQTPPLFAPSVLRHSCSLAGKSLMTKLVGLDILSPDFDTETDILHPAGTPIMLAVLNISLPTVTF